MTRSVSPLLLGLAICMAFGCASAGTNRRADLADRSLSRQPGDKKLGSNSSAADSGIVSFRPPRRQAPDDAPSMAQVEPESEAMPFSGHSGQRLPDVSAARTAKTWDEPVTQAAHQAEPDLLEKGDDSHSGSGTEVTASKVIDAHFRSDRDTAENPVQLQGLLVDGMSATPGELPQRDSVEHHATVAVSPWQSELERLIGRAEHELAAMSPTNRQTQAEYRRLQVHLRLLYLMAHHPEQALTAIPALDPADQEYWQQIVWAITNSLDADEALTNRERAAQTIPPVNTALRRLREQADLTLRNAAFCEEISYFGNYKRFPREEFVPGQPVLLYAEIENFRSEPLATSGEYRTLMRSLIEIVGPEGKVVWNKSFAATEDLCRNPRRDYFHNYQFTIPERLRLGPHTLKLTVVDELSGKQASSTIRFMVK